MNYKTTLKLIKNYIFYIFFFSSPNKIKRKQLKNETEKYLLQEKDKVLFVHRVYKPSKKSNVFFYIFFFSLYSLTSFLAPYSSSKKKYFCLLWAFNFFLFYILYIIRRYSTLFFSKKTLCLVFAIEHVLIINFGFIANALFCKNNKLPKHFETLKNNAEAFMLSDFIAVLMFNFLYQFFIKFYLKTGPKNIWADFVNYLFAGLLYLFFSLLFAVITWAIGPLLGFDIHEFMSGLKESVKFINTPEEPRRGDQLAQNQQLLRNLQDQQLLRNLQVAAENWNALRNQQLFNLGDEEANRNEFVNLQNQQLVNLEDAEWDY